MRTEGSAAPKTPFSRELREITLRLAEGIGGARALTVAIMVRYELWDDLAQLKTSPVDYCDAKAYARAAAITAFLRKCEDLPTTFDRRAKALENWWKGERGCYNANERLSPYLPQHANAVERDPRIAEFFSAVRKTIERWIGPAPNELTLGRFGPGATASDPAQFSTVPDKMSSIPSMTRDAWPFLPQWLATRWGAHCALKSRSPTTVRGNSFSVAPKDATKFRAIASEPSINIFYQLGLGSELKRCLRDIGSSSAKYMVRGLKRSRISQKGVDLVNGKDIHMRVACEASKQGHLATLDLSNASDSEALNLVRLIFPTRWFEALEALRSPFTRVDGKWVKLEKFSSMGNGYTFEVETITFLALCHEAMWSAGIIPQIGVNLFVYGDDIIVPTGAVRACVAVLRFCGFELNSDKSFVDGPFRESCGGDYFDGHSVRPTFVDSQPYEPQHYIVIANGLRALTKNLAEVDSFAMVQRAWFACLDALPRRVRSCRGPEVLGDMVIHDDEKFWQVRRRGQFRYLRVYRIHRLRSVSYGNFHPDVVLACATYPLVGTGKAMAVTPRDAVLSYKVGWKAWS